MIENITKNTTYAGIQDAIDNANDGDILEGSGTHSEQFTFENRADITLRNAPGQTFSVNGAIPASELNWIYSGVGSSGYDEWLLLNYSTFAFFSTDLYAYYHPNAVEQRLWTYPVQNEFNDFITGGGVFYDDTNDELVMSVVEANANLLDVRLSKYEYICQLSNSQNITLSGIAFDCAQAAILLRNDNDGHLVERCPITNATRAIWFKGKSTDSTNNVRIAYNRFFNLWRNDLYGWDQVKKPGVPNRIGNMQSIAVQMQCKGVGNIAEHNYIKQHFDGIRTGPDTFLGAHLDGAIVRKNWIEYCLDDAIDIQHYHINTQIYANVCIDNFKSIAGVPHINGRTYVFSNWFEARGQTLKDYTTGEMWERTNTKFYDHADGPCENIRFYNNTWIGEKTAFELGLSVTDFVMRNNIFWTDGAVSPPVVRGIGLASDGMQWDGNTYGRPASVTGNFVTDWNGTGSHSSLAAARTASGVFEANGQEADPLLDIPNRTVPANSPVVGAALPLDAAWPWDTDVLGPLPTDGGWYQQGRAVPLAIEETGPDGDLTTTPDPDPDPDPPSGGSGGGCDCVCIPTTRRVTVSEVNPISEVVTITVRV